MSETHNQSLHELRLQAIENARVARESIGEDVLDRAVAMIKKAKEQQESHAAQQARAQIGSHSLEDLTRELRYMLETDKQ